MLWRVGAYQFDEDRKMLRGDGREVLLEPKAAALLAYLCRHPGRNIGRDELLESVWYGQIVSDNSINRVIVLLRKALLDEDKVRHYIATVPKVGYRLIADVARAGEGADDSALAIANGSGYRTALIVAGLLVVLAAVYFLFPDRLSPDTADRLSIVPLSRLAANQSNADLAKDGESLLYTAPNNGRSVIYLQNGAETEPRVISAGGGDADLAAWANNDAFVVYVFLEGERCEFHRIDPLSGIFAPPTVIYECAPGNYTEFAFSPDNRKLYFVERASAFAPYAVYELDIAQRSKRRLSQPVASGLGNHFVDVHPVSGALLLLGDHLPGKTSAYELDPGSDSFTLRKAFDYSVESAVWSHRNGYVVHPSEHPSYQLLETSFETGRSDVIVSDSRRIRSPRRLRQAGSSGYLFTSYIFNRDVVLNPNSDASINSAVMDYLPAFSNDGQQLAFVSKRSGDSLVWIRDFRDGSLRALDAYDPGRRYLNLVWSPDDGRLLAHTNTGLLVYDFDDDDYVYNVERSLPVYAASWHDTDTLSFSHYEDGAWQAYHYSLDSGEAEALDARWAFSVRNDSQHLLVDQVLLTYRDGQLLSALDACANFVWRYQLRVQLDGDDIVCNARNAARDLLRFDQNMQVTRLPEAVSRYEFYSKRGQRLATTAVVSANSDIMRTRGD